MSPLARFLMAVLHKGSWGAAGFLLLFAGLLVYQRWTADGLALETGDYGFLAVLGIMFVLAFYLVRAIRKELDGSQSKDTTQP